MTNAANEKVYTVHSPEEPFDVWLFSKSGREPQRYRIPSWRVEFDVGPLKGVDVRLHKSLDGFHGWTLSEGSSGFRMYGGLEQSAEVASRDLLEAFVTFALPKLTREYVEASIANARERVRPLELPVAMGYTAQVENLEYTGYGVVIDAPNRRPHGFWWAGAWCAQEVAEKIASKSGPAAHVVLISSMGMATEADSCLR